MKNFLHCFAIFGMLIFSSALSGATVTGVNPLVGPKAGGTTVTITGTGFSGATQVLFGSTPAASFTVHSANTITAITPAAVPSNVDIIVYAPSGISTASAADIFTFQGVWFAYVGSFTPTAGGVTPINLSTNALQPAIATGTNSSPIGTVVTPDNRLAITGDDNNDKLVFIDLVTSAVVTTIPLTGAGAGALAITPNGQYVYVVNEFSETIDVVNVQNPLLTIVSIALPTGAFPVAIAITPDGTRAYVANAGNDTVSVIDTANNTVLTAISSSTTPTDVAVTPNGQYVLVTNQNSNTVSVIEQVSNTIVATIPVGANPAKIAVTPGGLIAYSVNFGDNTMSRINLETFTVDATITGVDQGGGIAITPDGHIAYVSNSASVGTVIPVDLTTNPETLLTAIPGLSFPGGISITPDQSPVARFVAHLKETGAASSFDASQSVSPVGTVTSYLWDFGDGIVVRTTSPTITHTYHRAGQFIVTLTVTNSAGTSTAKVFTGQTMSNSGNSYFAVREQLLNVQLRAPTHFNGKVIKNKKRGKIQYKLQTKWKKPQDTTVAYYEIFQHHRRIAKISVQKHRRFTKLLQPFSFFKTHDHSYKHFLHKKYKIRAVDSHGNQSSFNHLKVRKISTK